MRLEQIGFYTLSDRRASVANEETPLSRCELILTGRCNFSCPYCRHIGGRDMSLQSAFDTVDLWVQNGLKAIRFSGGEPTIYPHLAKLVSFAKTSGIEKIAVSTNGSASLDYYKRLIECGVNDFSISLDACCAEDGDKMAGGVKGAWETVVKNIYELSKLTYVTVGVVLTSTNLHSVNDIVIYASGLGVQDIRIIPAAQDGDRLRDVKIDESLLNKHPILAYRIRNIQRGLPVRGITESDSRRCGLVLDDVAVMGEEHFPCIIYMREGGQPIGRIGKNMRKERSDWYKKHNTGTDPICKKNCLDVCVQYNNAFQNTNPEARLVGL